MNIDSIQNGYVIDHIPAGKGIQLFEYLQLGRADYSVAMIINAQSRNMGKKDIIKIDADITLDLDVVGYFTPGATVNRIQNGAIIKKEKPMLPKKLTNVIRCKNPRCITSTEQGLPQCFLLTDDAQKVYRCYYCEAKGE